MNLIEVDPEDRRRLASVMKKVSEDWALHKVNNKFWFTGQEYTALMGALRLLSKEPKIEVDAKEEAP